MVLLLEANVYRFLQSCVVSVESLLVTTMSEKVIILIVLVITIKWTVSIKPLTISPVPSATLFFHISYIGTMLYFDHCTCKVWEDALHIVHITKHLQVLKQANKIFLQCTVHKPKPFKLKLEVSQTVQTRN